jgi:hypothetical protein
MNLDRHFFVMLFMLAAFVFFVLYALVTGGVFTWSLPWLLGAGLSSATLSVLVYLYQGRGVHD